MAEGLTQQGHDVTVYTPLIANTPDDETLATVRRVAPTLQYGNGGLFPTITHDLDTFDLVHLHYPFFGVAGKITRFIQRHSHIPLVTSYHMDPRGSGLIGLYMKAYARWYMPNVLTASDAIIVSTKDFAQACEANHLYRMNPNMWHEIPFGVDTNRFVIEARSVALRASWGAADIPVCLFVGGMDTSHHFKGVPQLLKAFRLASQLQDMRLVLVGDGNERPKFEAIARGLGLSDRVIFAGRVDSADLPIYYASVEKTILPSTSMAESFGMVLLESLACGTSVISSDLPGVRQIATIAGETVPVNDIDVLARALSTVRIVEEYEREEIRNAIVARYTWPVVVSQIEQVYQRVLEKRR
jgi:glycosyltransferase involved in cell wall biosynthesis